MTLNILFMAAIFSRQADLTASTNAHLAVWNIVTKIQERRWPSHSRNDMKVWLPDWCHEILARHMKSNTIPRSWRLAISTFISSPAHFYMTVSWEIIWIDMKYRQPTANTRILIFSEQIPHILILMASHDTARQWCTSYYKAHGSRRAPLTGVALL